MKKKIAAWLLVTVFALSSVFNTGTVFAAADTSVDRVFGQATHVKYYGSNRYETSFKTADALKQSLGTDKFENIVVAYGLNFPDALTGSYLAKEKNAPVLLVDPSVEAAVSEYIFANLADGGTVYLLGGVNAISADFESDLKSGVNVKRLAGGDRYETNFYILQECDFSSEEMLICTGSGFADSLSASAAGKPILLVGSTMTEQQKQILGQTTATTCYLIGGPNAVSEAVAADAGLSKTAVRVAGSNRYATSVEVAKRFCPDAENVVLAYGLNFPDGLSGAPLALSLEAPLVLTTNNAGDAAITSDYTKNTMKASHVVSLGGQGLISDATAIMHLAGVAGNDDPVVPDDPEDPIVPDDPEEPGIQEQYQQLVEKRDAALAAMNEADAQVASVNTTKSKAAEANNAAETELAKSQETLAAAKAGMNTAADELDAAKEELKKAEKAYQDKIAQAQEKVDTALAEYNSAGKDFILEHCMTYKDDAGNIVDSYTVWKVLMKNNVTLAPYVNDTFEEVMEYQFRTESLKTAMTFIDECNELRAGEGVEALEVDFDMMLISAVSNAVSTQAGYAGNHLFFYTAMYDDNMFDILLNASGSGVAENLSFGYKDPYDGWYYKEKKLYQEGERENQKVGHYLSIINERYHITGFAMSPKSVSEQSFGTYEGLGITTKVFLQLLDEHTEEETEKLNTAKAELAAVPNGDVIQAQVALNEKQAAYDEAVAAAEKAQEDVDLDSAMVVYTAGVLSEAAAKYDAAVKDFEEKEKAYEAAAKAVEDFAKNNNITQ